MTREEEKKKARWEYVSKRLANPDFPTYNAEYELETAFDKGAEWADAHPDIDVRTIAAWQSGYKEAIEKACEWLSAELDKEEERHYIHVHGFDKERREIFLEDFRKAMKGGEK